MGKRVTFADLANAKLPEDKPPTTSHHQSPPVVDIAPKRDFNKRANSLERDAMPSGLFPGSTKKVYDALYLRTRGAIKPVKMVRASRRDLLEWTGIRNLKTIDNHVRYLMAVGLINRHWERGSNEGAQYEVNLPEDLPPLTTTHHQSPSDTTSQNLSSGYSYFSGTGGDSQKLDNTGLTTQPKTIKTNTINDDDEAFAKFIRVLQETTKEVTGKESSNSETERWRELAELLSTELKIAAARTNVSSVPAFLTEHLRRRLWKVDKKQMSREDQEERPTNSSEKQSITPEQIRHCPDCGGTGFYYPNGFDGGVAKCKHEHTNAEH